MALQVNTYQLPTGETELELRRPATWEQSLMDVGGNAAICIFEDDAMPADSVTFHVVPDGDDLPAGVLDYVGSVAVGGFGVRHVFRERMP